MDRTRITVTGMACTGCEQTVENAIGSLDEVTRVEADHEADAVEVVAREGVTDEALHAAIEEAGYDVGS